jgi:hypothetical protein
MASIGLAYFCCDRSADQALLGVEAAGRGLDDLQPVTGDLGGKPAVRHSQAVLFSTLGF